ncbi:MAG: adenine-specific methyltransferase EcoRI family protein [Lachnospiraceae bacterium]|nr:adenine-specific methyltransferase EcoRI family protein [Lachnospiraceae bacterium]
MAGNSNLHDSAKNKQDEFYTQLSLVESELKHYRQHFKDKIVLCNCDDPYESNFFKYFAMNFNSLGLKKLITTCYVSSPVTGKEFQYYVGKGGQLTFIPTETPVISDSDRHPYKVEITEVTDENGDGRIDLSDVEYLMRNRKNTMTLLDGDGDFRSPECIELLQQADIVVTNPPFSLFREYMELLERFQKKYIIIGNMNAVTYKEIFPLIAQNRLWLGYNSGHFWFKVPDTYEEKKTDFKIDETGQKWRRMGNICWFTNVDIEKRHENMTLFRNYTPEAYPKYDNYDAINVDRTVDIPCDYYGVMGVPITFLSQYSPEQFEIVAFRKGNDGKDLVYSFTESSHSLNVERERRTTVRPYFRILIRRIQTKHRTM